VVGDFIAKLCARIFWEVNDNEYDKCIVAIVLTPWI